MRPRSALATPDSYLFCSLQLIPGSNSPCLTSNGPSFTLFATRFLPTTSKFSQARCRRRRQARCPPYLDSSCRPWPCNCGSWIRCFRERRQHVGFSLIKDLAGFGGGLGIDPPGTLCLERLARQINRFPSSFHLDIFLVPCSNPSTTNGVPTRRRCPRTGTNTSTRSSATSLPALRRRLRGLWLL